MIRQTVRPAAASPFFRAPPLPWRATPGELIFRKDDIFIGRVLIYLGPLWHRETWEIDRLCGWRCGKFIGDIGHVATTDDVVYMTNRKTGERTRTAFRYLRNSRTWRLADAA